MDEREFRYDYPEFPGDWTEPEDSTDIEEDSTDIEEDLPDPLDFLDAPMDDEDDEDDEDVSNPHYQNWLIPVESRKQILIYKMPGCDPVYGTTHDDATLGYDSRNDTYFFWNMDDYPVPVDTDLATVSNNITRAFRIMGFKWNVYLCADCKQPDNVEQAIQFRGTKYLPNLSGAYRKLKAVPTLDMSFYMLQLAGDTGTEHANVAVIVKPDSDPNSDLRRVLHCLASRGHDVLLVMPPPDKEFSFSVDSLVVHARFLGGGMPRSNYQYQPPPDDSDDDYDVFEVYDVDEEDDVVDVDEEDDVSHVSNNKMLDFSEPIRLVKGSRTVIFWDTMDCPFPLCLSPDQIFEKIKSALVGRGYCDNITVWAYVDEYRKGSWREKYLGDKTWDSNIYFLPGGDKASRRVRMLNDMHLLSRDAPLSNHGGSLILVSDHFFNDPCYMEMFQYMESVGYALVLLCNVSESLVEWPGALDKAGVHFGFETRVLKLAS